MEKTDNPLARALQDWLPALDFGVIEHCFTPYGRDYYFIIEDCIGPKPGSYHLTFSHVVEYQYVTRVGDEAWRDSWADEFTDYQAWLDAGEPEGYVWGTNWSLAYPGITTASDTEAAVEWTHRLKKPMHSMKLETNQYQLDLVFHELQTQKISDDASTVSQVIIPLKG